MAYLTWLSGALRASGLPVREIPGWQTRGHGVMSDVRGVLCHHTAGPASGDGRLGDLRVPGYPSLGIVVNGRAGLAGPLANLGLARDGTWLVIAAGSAWHAGTGAISWCPTNAGNSHLIGIEAESVGTRDDWTQAQRESYPRGVAALLRDLGLPSSRAIGHKEWAPARKIDPAFWEMGAFRRDVDRWLTTSGPQVSPKHARSGPREDDCMYVKCQPAPDKPVMVAVLSGPMFVGLGSPGELKSAEGEIAKGATCQWVELHTWLDFDRRSQALCANPRAVALVNQIPPGGQS